MRRILIALLTALALTGCTTVTAPHNDGGCPPGYLMSSARQCVPG